MRWLLVGLCGLALVNLSAPIPQAAITQEPHITQKPRFYGVMGRGRAIIYCESPLVPPLHVDWFWAKDSDQDVQGPMRPNANVVIQGKKIQHSAFLLLKDVGPSDSGVYYCEVNGTRGAGTGVQVLRPRNTSKVEKRSTMKDAFIILQTLMLAICVAAPLVQKYILVKKEDAIYEDPQQDHTYEGLTVETCEPALYEDISAYAQTGGPEAPWES